MENTRERSVESMMSGGVCCAESNRRNMILTATTGAGYVYCRELKAYLEKMLYLRYIFSLIKGRDRLYACSTAGNIYRGGKTSEKTIPYMAS